MTDEMPPLLPRRSKRLNGSPTAAGKSTSGSGNGTSKKVRQANPQLEEIMDRGRDMMNRSEKMMGAPATEDRRFREMFGVCPEVALVAWQMMCSAGILPEGGTLMHWLWTLCFLKVYAKQGPLSVLCGGADPKTMHKWVVLEGDVVSYHITLHCIAFCSIDSAVANHLLLFK